MGSQQSKAGVAVGSCIKTTQMAGKTTKKEDEDKRYPSTVVLVPPSFGVGPAETLPFTLATQDALEASSFFPVLWNYIQVSDPSYRLLNDHLQTGFWFHTTTPSVPPFDVSGSMVLLNNNNRKNGVAGAVGRVVAETQFDPMWHAQVRGGTDDDDDGTGGGGSPSLVVTHEGLVPGLVFKGATNTQGDAWLSSILLYSQPNLDVRAVAWLPLEFRRHNNNEKQEKTTVVQQEEVLVNIPHVTVFGAARWGPMTAAMESQIPSTPDEAPKHKYYWTCSSISSSSSSSSSDDNPSSKNTAGPPLQITLQKTNEYATLALSQIFTFDRLQFNPMEDRSPWVRNTVGWTVAMEKAYHHNKEDESVVLLPPPPQVAVAGAWQVNRALALKAVVRPQQQHVTFAVILKRWNQPRITLSLLGRHYWGKDGGGGGYTGLLGVGVELETEQHDPDVSYQDTTTYSYAHQQPRVPAPETRAV